MSRVPFHVASAITVCAVVLAGCASAPAIRVHTLMPAEPPQRAAGAAPISAVLEPIRLPAQVDQPQWLVRLPDDTLAVLEQERWASPLRDELRLALLEELIARWNMSEARPAPGAPAPIRIGVDVRRFDSVIGSGARIEGSWTLVSGDPRLTPSRCEWFILEAAGASTPALAAAHRRAVARLAGAIGDNLARVSRGERATCPPLDSAG